MIRTSTQPKFKQASNIKETINSDKRKDEKGLKIGFCDESLDGDAEVSEDLSGEEEQNQPSMSVKSLRKLTISQSLRQSIALTKPLIEKPNPLLLIQEMSDFS
jgi:hypothetical protein